jgi:hypothetical protein
MYPKRHLSFIRRRESSALVLTLAALVLVSGIILVFFNLSTLNRQISFSSAGQFRADTLAHTAMDTITGDLRNEIVAGSTLTNVGTGATTSNLYIPTTNFTVVPYRVGDQGFANLIAESASTSNFWTGANYNATVTSPIRSAANNSTTNTSLNGRYIALGRWNKPGLLGDPGSGTSPQMTNNSPTTGNPYVPPDWVIVTRQGPIATATTAMPSMATLADRSTANQNYAVGRYAYTVYDEGGLIDANAVGVPASAEGTTFVSQRGMLPQVDLSNLLANLPTPDPNATADANALVAWRNAGTIQSPINYTNYIQNATNGFVTAAGVGQSVTIRNANGTTTTTTVPTPGDQAFLSRQDLINYIKNNGTIPTAALQYLGTFTRDSDGPSYYPNPNRHPSPNGLAADNLVNPNVLSIPVQKAFQRIYSDNAQAVVGEPLLKHRFPLARLALFQNPTGSSVINGVTYQNSALIKTFFAMQQHGDGTWDYVDPDSGSVMSTLPTIKTLAQVAANAPPASPTPREPDFWELLQAGILTGSLGTVNCWTGAVNPVSPSATIGFNGTITAQDASTTRQVLAIGLNIIDQYTAAASPPTPFVLNLGGMTPTTATGTTLLSGTLTPTQINNNTPVPTQTSVLNKNILDSLPIISEENLPYIYYMANNEFYDLKTTPAPPFPGDPNDSPAPETDDYLQFILWNPHRNAASAPTGSFRLICTGSTYTVGYNKYPAGPGTPPQWPAGGPTTPGTFGTSIPINWGVNTTTNPKVAFTFATSSAATFSFPTILGANPGVIPSNGLGETAVASPVSINAQFPSPLSGGGPSEIGLLLGQFQTYYPTPPKPPAPATAPNYGWYWFYNSNSDENFSPLYAFFGGPFNPPLTMVLEVSVGGNWIPYQILPDFQYNGMGTLGESFTQNSLGFASQVNYFGPAAAAAGSGGVGHADPRTMRFGLMDSSYDSYPGGSTSLPMVSNVGQGILLSDYQLTQTAQTGTPGAGFGFYPLADLPTTNNSAFAPVILTDFAYNLDPSLFPSAQPNANGVHSYADPDGVYRKGDNNPAANEIGNPELHLTDSPYYINQSSPSTPNDALPVMLNRPFASVAELGYAYRDIAWRSLDFSSQNSADGGLLDLFCLNQNNNPLRAGVLDLNSASIPVLTAVMTGTATDPAFGAANNPAKITTTPPLTSAQATTLATGIYNAIHPSTGTGLVLGNPADIPKLVAELGTNNCYPAPTAAANYGPKFRRETVSRAFADVTNTRTWNLMIDVVAQAGRYTAASKTLNDFVVEGERRYWLHVAIDRFTGKVVDSQIEPVSE